MGRLLHLFTFTSIFVTETRHPSAVFVYQHNRVWRVNPLVGKTTASYLFLLQKLESGVSCPEVFLCLGSSGPSISVPRSPHVFVSGARRTFCIPSFPALPPAVPHHPTDSHVSNDLRWRDGPCRVNACTHRPCRLWMVVPIVHPPSSFLAFGSRF